VKVRIQIVGEENAIKGIKESVSPFTVGANVLKEDGIKGLYRGIDAALLR